MHRLPRGLAAAIGTAMVGGHGVWRCDAAASRDGEAGPFATRGRHSDPAKWTTLAVVGGHAGMMEHGQYVYKPLQRGRRGRAESEFYHTTCPPPSASTPHVTPPPPPCAFMPRFYGIHTEVERVVEGDNGSGGGGAAAAGAVTVEREYLVLENLLARFRKPCVMDVKIGVQTWDEDAPPAKVASERQRYPLMQVVGLRFTGMRVWLPGAQRYKEHGRAYGYRLTEHTLGTAFEEYLNNGGRVRRDVIPPLLHRLSAIRAWFASQSRFRFYGSSLLFVYEGDDTVGDGRDGGGDPPVDVRMIDFAHVWPIHPPAPPPAGTTTTAGMRDDGYLLGLDNVIAMLQAVYTEQEGGGHSSSLTSTTLPTDHTATRP